MFSLWTSNVKGQNESKNLQNFDLLGALEIRGYEKLRFLLQKAHPCVNARRLSHLRQNWLGGLTSRGEPKKSQKVTRGSHRNDVSPLTQGLRYRAACDAMILSIDKVLLKRKLRFTHLQNFEMLLAICKKKLAIFASTGNYFMPLLTYLLTCLSPTVFEILTHFASK